MTVTIFFFILAACQLCVLFVKECRNESLSVDITRNAPASGTVATITTVSIKTRDIIRQPGNIERIKAGYGPDNAVKSKWVVFFVLDFARSTTRARHGGASYYGGPDEIELTATHDMLWNMLR